jgi:hypothetical protein
VTVFLLQGSVVYLFLPTYLSACRKISILARFFDEQTAAKENRRQRIDFGGGSR